MDAQNDPGYKFTRDEYPAKYISYRVRVGHYTYFLVMDGPLYANVRLDLCRRERRKNERKR